MPRLTRGTHGSMLASRPLPRVWPQAALLVALVACGSGKHAAAPIPTGNIAVTITPANGVTPSVTITGPNSYTKTLSATTVLTGLKLGSYSVHADSAVAPDSIVGTVIDTGTVTGGTVTLASHDTAKVSVTYATKYRTGGLWIALNGHPRLFDYSSNQLRASDSVAPAVSLGTGSGPAGLALDQSGNMWEGSYNNDTLRMYTVAKRTSGDSTSTPSLTLQSDSITHAENLATDSHGNLWVANCGGHRILEFSAAQLAAGGTGIVPAVTIRDTTGTIFACPYSIAFDANGNAWVADDGKNLIAEYTPAQLAASGHPIPVRTIRDTSGTLSGPTGVAFDASGNLWVANLGSTTVVSYSASQLATGGALTPAVTITMPTNADPFGIAFDHRGTLWVTDDNNGYVFGFSSAQLTTTGSPTPAVRIAPIVTNEQPEQPLFDPYTTAVGPSVSRLRHTPVSLSMGRATARPNRLPTH